MFKCSRLSSQSIVTETIVIFIVTVLLVLATTIGVHSCNLDLAMAMAIGWTYSHNQVWPQL